ncbi:MAG: carboxypeptidase-like regulatory domain-containing protein, partial [Flavihumibacter sp.]
MKFVSTLLLAMFLLIHGQSATAQVRAAQVEGVVISDEEQPLSGVSITILGREGGTHTLDSGKFSLPVPAGRAVALVFTHVGYKPQQQNFLVARGKTENVIIRLERSGQLEGVTVTDERSRREAGLISVDPKLAINLPSPGGGIESLIKVFVGSNNELTSNYNVRGGSYDENLIYVNDFEVYRPYLVRNGQQEGLSFINPEMTRSVQFYNGGFQARYGDKMSSVLDIGYKKPKSSGGSAYAGLLEQGLQLEGISNNKKFSYLVGARHRNNRNLLSSQETKGSYVPRAADFQGLFTWQIGQKWAAELLTHFSQTSFGLQPKFSQPSAAVFSPFFTSNLGLDIYFDGREEDRYNTAMAGLSIVQQVRKNIRLKWMASFFKDREQESIDIAGAYLFGERSFDKSQPDYGSIVKPLGAGAYLNYARNKLDINVYNLS